MILGYGGLEIELRYISTGAINFWGKRLFSYSYLSELNVEITAKQFCYETQDSA